MVLHMKYLFILSLQETDQSKISLSNDFMQFVRLFCVAFAHFLLLLWNGVLAHFPTIFNQWCTGAGV